VTIAYPIIAKRAVAAGALQKPAELAGLLRRAASIQPRVIVEIGSDAGGTLYAWRVAFPAAQVAGALRNPQGRLQTSVRLMTTQQLILASADGQ
jgi:hypothetical protein